MQQTDKHTLKSDVNNFLSRWHSDFILDYWWRKKHNVAFGSSQHRQMNFIDMFIEYCEDEKIKQIQEQEQQIDSSDDGIKISQKEIDDDYDNLDLTNFSNA